MKKIFICMFLLSIALNAQTWNNEVTTTIPADETVEEVENFVNKDGIHIVTRTDTDSIKYYRINSSGTVLHDTLITTSGDYPNIVGDNDNIFILYLSGSSIRIKLSTDAGITWSDKTSLSISSTDYSGLDAFNDDYYIHTVWSREDTTEEVYYKKYRPIQNDWVEYRHITDGSDYGVSPSISVGTDDKIHVSFVENQDIVKSRTYNNGWESVEQFGIQKAMEFGINQKYLRQQMIFFADSQNK